MPKYVDQQDLVEAAASLVHEQRTIRGLSLDAIAQAGGSNKRTLLNKYRNKNRLVEELAAQAAGAWWQHAAAGGAAHSGLLRRAAGTADATAKIAGTAHPLRPPSVTVVAMLDYDPGHPARDAADDFCLRLTRLLDPDGTDRATASAVVSAVVGASVLALSDGNLEPLHTLAIALEKAADER